jgi:hypothetical protein
MGGVGPLWGVGVCGCVNGEIFVDSVWRIALSLASRLFIAKIEMAMRCRDVFKREVGVKCCGVQGCCVGVKSGVRSYGSMVKVVASEKTNSVAAAARS